LVTLLSPCALDSVLINNTIYRFVIYVDDLGQKFPSLLEEFQQRVLTANESPDGAFLQAFRDHLCTDMYKFWDPIPANCITLSALDFINGCLLEEMPIIRDMKISTAAHSWPYYLRAKTGCSAAYAFMIFPRESNPDMSGYIQAIEDIILYTNLVNDILSYVFVVPSNKIIVTITLLDSTRS
jgi:Trichodiene synthase (TRI5)